MDPFTNLPFGICAIYFDLDSRSSGIVKSYRNSQSMYFFVVETDRQLLPRFCDYYSAVYKNCQGSMASQIQHPPHCCLSNIHSTPTEIPENHTTSIWILPAAANLFFRLPNKRPTPISTSIHDAARLKLVEFALEFVRTGELTGDGSWINWNDFTPRKCANNMKQWYVFFGCLTLK